VSFAFISFHLCSQREDNPSGVQLSGNGTGLPCNNGSGSGNESLTIRFSEVRESALWKQSVFWMLVKRFVVQVHLEGRFGNRSFVYPGGAGFPGYDGTMLSTGKCSTAIEDKNELQPWILIYCKVTNEPILLFFTSEGLKQKVNCWKWQITELTRKALDVGLVLKLLS